MKRGKSPARGGDENDENEKPLLKRGGKKKKKGAGEDDEDSDSDIEKGEEEVRACGTP